MSPVRTPKFDDADLLRTLPSLDAAAQDALAFGVIGFDTTGCVTVYNRTESAATGLQPSDVLGRPLFTEVAQCMNNYLVALRYEEAEDTGSELDLTLPYVLTWRMKPQKVRLRLLSAPGLGTRYLAIERV